VFITFLFSSLFLAMAVGDSINSQQTEISKSEGEPVTLSCSYSTSNQYVFLYWYRQYSLQPPQYILREGAGSYSGQKNTADFAKNHFISTTGQDSTKLTISSLIPGDTARYYCALWVAHCDKEI
ncbi:KV4A1 protein, partial [Amia calva]|nr:KV4A1 protein [Amia calva]